MNTEQAKAALREIALAVVEIIDSKGEMGKPAGELYAVLMQYMSLEHFENLMAALVATGKVTKRGLVYYGAGK